LKLGNNYRTKRSNSVSASTTTRTSPTTTIHNSQDKSTNNYRTKRSNSVSASTTTRTSPTTTIRNSQDKSTNRTFRSVSCSSSPIKKVPKSQLSKSAPQLRTPEINQWYWDDRGVWKPYGTYSNIAIQNSYANNEKKYVFTRPHGSYEIKFKTMEQVNVLTQISKTIMCTNKKDKTCIKVGKSELPSQNKSPASDEDNDGDDVDDDLLASM